MTVKEQEKRRTQLINQENKLLGELPIQRISLALSYTKSLKDDDFFIQEQMKEQQAKMAALPTWTPTKKELKRIREAEEAVKRGEVTKAINPKNKKDLKEVLGF